MSPYAHPLVWSLLAHLVPATDLPAQMATTVEAEAMPKVQLVQPTEFPGTNWVFFSGKKEARLEETWVLDLQSSDGPVLICKGEPQGYLRTVDTYSDFDFGLEWKYPSDPAGNSGILLCTTGEDKIWPAAVQVQLHQPRTGSIFGSGGTTVSPQIETNNHFTRPINHWNELSISNRSGHLTLTINGKFIGETQVQSSPIGCIGLQSEGSEIHFRRIWIRDLSPPRAPMGGAVGAAGRSLAPSPCPWGPACCAGSGGCLAWSSGYGWSFAPSSASWLAYQKMPGWYAPSYLPPLAPQRRMNREPTNVPNGIPLAGRADLRPAGRSPGLAGSAAEEWSAGGRRSLVHAGRGGRGRH